MPWWNSCAPARRAPTGPGVHDHEQRIDRQTVCWEYHKYAERVLQGVLEDDSFFAFVAGLDKGDDWRDEAVWEKANPLLDVSITRKYLREQVRQAVGMPAKQAIVRRLNFCEWTERQAGSPRRCGTLSRPTSIFGTTTAADVMAR